MTVLDQLPAHLVDKAAGLDAADPLAAYRDEFVAADGLVCYLDGNSLGRPLAVTRDHVADFLAGDWGGRLIRAWDEQWMDAPTALGDRIARVALGAGAGQTVVADSTTVMLYKLARAAVDARPARDEIVADTGNFPTDRYILRSIAAERGLTIRWIEPRPAAGVTVEQVRAAVGPRTALVLLSHVDYRSAYVADLPGITAAAHQAGALMLWDLCHSAGVVEVDLDRHDVDLAVGCTYKYLNGGPGSPAFGYVAARLQDTLRQPVTGWMGADDPFAMETEDYRPATGIRRFISGTPPIVGMLPLRDMLDVVERAGLPAIRAKSVALTELAIEIADEVLATYGAEVASPRDPADRGGHVLVNHPEARRATEELWRRGVIPDYRPPSGIRLGLSPLSTGFAELAAGLAHLAEVLKES
jgi:kynureninase